MNQFTKRGFTLIELLVVIAIIGILSSVVLASLNSARQKSRDARRVADIKQLQTALELYYDANSQSYPSGTALTPLAGTYIPAVAVDPTNSGSYVYSYQALDSASAACSAASCPSYVLKAALEASSTVLGADIDGTVGGVACADGTAAPFLYCVRP